MNHKWWPTSRVKESYKLSMQKNNKYQVHQGFQHAYRAIQIKYVQLIHNTISFKYKGTYLKFDYLYYFQFYLILLHYSTG